MAETARRLMTVEEFLVWDDGTDRRYELIDGEPVMMAPARRGHGRLIVRLAAILEGCLPAGYETIAEAGIRLPNRNHDFYETDIAIAPIGSVADNDEKFVANPICVIEVLSPTTERHDRLRKVGEYKLLPSVRDIALISAERRRVETVSRRTDGTWPDTLAVDTTTLNLSALGLTIPLDEVYAGVKLPS